MSDTITIQGTKAAGGLFVYLVGKNGAGQVGGYHMIPHNGGTLSYVPTVEAPWQVSVADPTFMSPSIANLENVSPGETVCVSESERIVKHSVVDVTSGSCPKK